jgi:hypothetical protein
MAAETAPVATVTGLYRGTFSGLEPLTNDTPLTLDEVRRNPIFYELELQPQEEDADLIIDVIYDNMEPALCGSGPLAVRRDKGDGCGTSARRTAVTRARSSNLSSLPKDVMTDVESHQT